jgi:hypothetical protein
MSSSDWDCNTLRRVLAMTRDITEEYKQLNNRTLISLDDKKLSKVIYREINQLIIAPVVNILFNDIWSFIHRRSVGV